MRRGTPPIAAKGVHVRGDPVGQPLGPGCLHIGEVRGAHDGDEDLRPPHLAGQPVDDHRYGVAGVIDEQLVAAHMGLAHRDRELRLEAPVQFAEARDMLSITYLALCCGQIYVAAAGESQRYR
jgi:hypothetical protein